MEIGRYRPVRARADHLRRYTRPLPRLTERGYRQAVARITQPNEAGNGLHRSFGFQDAGVYRRPAWKHDGWHDIASMQLDLPDTGGPDGPPGPIC